MEGVVGCDGSCARVSWRTASSWVCSNCFALSRLERPCLLIVLLCCVAWRLTFIYVWQVTDLQLQYPVQDPQSKAFYEQAAVAAASMGIVVDVFAAARGYVGLQTLEPLVNSTGGALYLYPSAEEATLPQDLYR